MGFNSLPRPLLGLCVDCLRPVQWFWLLVGLPLFAASQEERFTIRSEVSIVARDQFRWEYRYTDGTLGMESTCDDTLTYQSACEEKLRIAGRVWETVAQSSQYTITGGGRYRDASYEGGVPSRVDEATWTYRTDPSRYDPLTSDLGIDLDTKFVDCYVGPSVKLPVAADATGPHPLGAQVTVGTIMMQALGLFADRVQLPTNLTRYTVTRVYATNLTIPYTGTGESGQQSAQYQCTVTIQRNPAELEAVILTNLPPEAPVPPYARWVPEAGEHEDDVGSTLVLRLIVRQKGSTDTVPVSYAKAKFTFRLNDVTREPGVCLNFPAKASARTSPDLRFRPSDDLRPLEEGLAAESTRDDLNAMSFGIDAFDYGAFGTLSITAQIQGQGEVQAYVEGRPDQVVLRIPVDENLNRIADSWEKAEGVWVGYDTSPAADGADDPSGQASNGDGIGLYERYRGFRSARGYERLKARPKYVFVRDPDSLLEWTLKHPEVRDRSFPKVTGCKVLLIDEEQWTGPGWRNEDRVVNFNTSGFGHAVDQHALHLVGNYESQPVHPSGWLELYNQGLSESEQMKTEVPLFNLGGTYPQPSLPSNATDSPKTAYRCLIYLGLFPNYELDMVKYHTGGVPDYQRFTSRDYYTGLPAADRSVAMSLITADAEEYIRNHTDEHNAWFRSMLNLVVTHELCHGLAAPHHAPATIDGDWDCVMRYFESGFWRNGDFPRTPDDRFELGLRKLWPHELCRSGNGQTEDSCWKTLRVSDKH